MSYTDYTLLKSEIDDSVNFVLKTNPGMIECRYVRRCEDYFIVYLSSQTGCNKACRMCHLTQTGQTAFRDVEFQEYLDQAHQVFDYYSSQTKAKTVHFNFMSRGEVFANRDLLISEAYTDLIKYLSDIAYRYKVIPKFKFSTIMPQEMHNRKLSEMFGPYNPDIYYSLYSVNPAFRKKWLPKSLPVEESLSILKEYQEHSHKIIKLHWAFIEGENDSFEDINQIRYEVKKAKLRVDFNIVRYNPYSELQGKEPSEEHIENLAYVLRRDFPESNVTIVPRVGFDVAASCGTFVGGRNSKYVSII